MADGAFTASGDRTGLAVRQSEHALDGVDGQHDRLGLEPGPRHVYLQFMNVACNLIHGVMYSTCLDIMKRYLPMYRRNNFIPNQSPTYLPR